MVGLLGTVDGMVASFGVIANSEQTLNPLNWPPVFRQLSIRHWLDLVIAIPLIICYNLLRNRVQRMVAEAGSESEAMIEKFEALRQGSAAKGEAMGMRHKFDTKMAEGDMTSMIDMVFQLIAFFMVLINFSQDDQNAKITLPESELAKPTEAPSEFPIVIHLDRDARVYMGANEGTVDSIRPFFPLKLPYCDRTRKKPKMATLSFGPIAKRPAERFKT